MRLKGSFYFEAVIMIVMAIALVDAFRMEYLTSKLLPLIFSATVFVLAGVGMVRALTGKEDPEAKERGDAGEHEEAAPEERVVGIWDGYLRAFGWILGVVVAVLLLGFLVTLPVFLLAYSRMNGARWVSSVVFAGGVTLFMWGFFEAGMRIELFRGVLLGGIIG